MEFYIAQSGNRAGPFSEEQVRSLLATGKFAVNDAAWHTGATDWRPLHQILNVVPPLPPNPFPAIPAQPSLDLSKPPNPVIGAPPQLQPADRLRDQNEGLAKGLCLGVGGVIALVLLLTGVGLTFLPWIFFAWAFSFLSAAILKANAVLISPHSWPELNALVEEAKAKLNLGEVSAFVAQDSVFNAFATRLAGRNFIVLNSGAVDALLRKGRLEDLKFLVGHECGHVALGHVNLLGGLVPRLCALFFYPLYAWYRRCQERSADRCGLWCAGNRADAHRSIAVLAGGSEMGSRLNRHAADEQWNLVRDEFWIGFARFVSEYPHTTERIALIHRGADELGLH